MGNNTCNQCLKEMNSYVDFGEKCISVCTNPECPNYSLLQIALEQMKKPKKKDKK